MSRPITVGTGSTRIVISREWAATLQAMIDATAPTVAATMREYLDESEAYIDQNWPRKGSTRFATGTSRARWAYLFTISGRGANTATLQATVLNTARWADRVNELSARLSELEVRLLRGEALTDEERRTMRVLRAQTRPLFVKKSSVKPYVIFVRKGTYWQHLRKMRTIAEGKIVENLGEELARLAGRTR